MIVTIRQLDCENRVIKFYETSLKSIRFGQFLVKFKVGSKSTEFDKIRLIKEVLSGFCILASVLRFFWFSCLYLCQALKCQSQKSNLTIGLKQQGKILVLMNYELNRMVGLEESNQSKFLDMLIQQHMSKMLQTQFQNLSFGLEEYFKYSLIKFF